MVKPPSDFSSQDIEINKISPLDISGNTIEGDNELTRNESLKI